MLRPNFLSCFMLGLAINSAASAQDFQLSDAADELRLIETDKPLETVDLRINGVMRSIPFVTDDQGKAIYQGDIVLGDALSLYNLSDGSDLSFQSLADSETELFGLVARDERLRWPEGRVPFFVDPNVPSSWLPRVYGAIREWERVTDIRFEELKSPEGVYVHFFDHPDQDACQTRMGRPRSGPRYIQLASWCQRGNVAHEIGHVLGLHHEQARSDRDNYINVVFSSNASDLMRAQFRANPTDYADLGPYCYDSIMHYPKTDRAKSFQITPRTDPGDNWTGVPQNMGQRGSISACDAAAVQQMYGFTGDTADAQASGFEGDLVFYPEGCEAERRCYLRNELRYTDPNSLGWVAAKRDDDAPSYIQSGTTDGASIPVWAQPFIGRPFDPSYIKAAVIHDHYTYPENRVRTWSASQRVFYDMLLDLGVSKSKAQIMYLGVLIGSRKWLELVPGEDCGENCINDVLDATKFVHRTEKNVFREWPEIYNSEEYDDAMKKGIAAIAVMGERMTPEDIDALAATLFPDHPVFSRSDTYQLDGLQDAILK